MPHAFKPLQREFPMFAAATNRESTLRWEAINGVSYLLGGVVFVVGSIFFLPAYSEYEVYGSMLFVVGSGLYLLVSCHDLMEELHSKNSEWINLFACSMYIFGSIIFVFGSIFFLTSVARYVAGAWCFISGSVMFTVGAIINALQIFHAQIKWNAQSMMLVALSYCIGSVIFLIASIPYLFTFISSDDEERIYRFLGAQYIAGSLFFLLGGVINWRRARQTAIHDIGGGIIENQDLQEEKADDLQSKESL